MTNQPAKRTYFGIVALVTGILSVLAFASNIAVAYLRISPEVFGQWNVITALFYCALTPLAFTLGVGGLYFKNDSKSLSWVVGW